MFDHPFYSKSVNSSSSSGTLNNTVSSYSGIYGGEDFLDRTVTISGDTIHFQELQNDLNPTIEYCETDVTLSFDDNSNSFISTGTYSKDGIEEYYQEDCTGPHTGEGIRLGQKQNTYYRDFDSDNYGDLQYSIKGTSQPSGYVSDNTDCNDYDYSIYPGAEEIRGDGIDQNCNGSDLTDAQTCGAYVAPGVWKEFDCYNLAAIGKTTNYDPFTPSWRLIGGYWQWGRKGPSSSQWYDTNTANFAHGPTGSGSSQANDNAITGWDSSNAGSGSWSNSYKTSNDPCPSGYRVPTKTQWEGVTKNNTQSIVGAWSSSLGATNYSSGRFFGKSLMLSATGYRYYYSGSLVERGYFGHYWSSTEDSSHSGYAWSLGVYSDSADTYYGYRSYGFPVRCISE